jgi:hypothetical protein
MSEFASATLGLRPRIHRKRSLDTSLPSSLHLNIHTY